MDLETRRLFTVCHNEMMIVLDADNGKIVAQVPIGKRVDGVIFDPSTKQAISSNGEGSEEIEHFARRQNPHGSIVPNGEKVRNVVCSNS